MFSFTIAEFTFLCVGFAFVGSLILFPSFRQQLKALAGGFLQVFVQDTSCLCKDAGTAGSYSSCRKDTAESEGKAGVSDERQSCSDFRESQQNIPGYTREWPVQADAACKYGKQENISPKPGDSFESVHNRDIQSAAR